MPTFSRQEKEDSLLLSLNFVNAAGTFGKERIESPHATFARIFCRHKRKKPEIFWPERKFMKFVRHGERE